MNHGLLLYQEFIDKLAGLSKSCTDAENVKQGSYPSIEANQAINTLLQKLTTEERQTLALCMQHCYSSGIFDVLSHLEWLSCCRDMKVFIDGHALPSNTFGGFSDDFIGRCEDWQWPKASKE